MKKIFLTLFSLFVFSSLSEAGSILDDVNSFQVARVSKIGRSSSTYSGETAITAGASSAQYIVICNDNCSSCDYTSGTCSSCETDYYLSDSNAGNSCLDCVSNATCNGKTYSCSTGYYNNGSSCSKCPTGATACTSAAVHTSCSSGYFLYSNYCTTCPSSSAYTTCSGSTLTCATGYYRNASTCTTCTTGCSACSSSSYCSSCSSNYYMSSNSCPSCPSNASCSGGTSSFTCNTGYYTSGSSCSKCATGCSACSSSTSCSSCSSGYYLKSSSCTSCPSNATCTGGSTTYNFTCNTGYYKASTTATSCTTCPTGCSACSSGTTCTACSSGYTLSNGSCVAETAASCSVWDSSDNGMWWNANGSKTITAGLDCWDGYGQYATITVPSGQVYDNVNVRFWSYATVSGGFTTRELRSQNHTSGTVNTATSDTEITFTGAVKVTETVILQQSTSSTSKGVVMKFTGGLSGSPSCKVVTSSSQYGPATTSTTKTCTCTTSQCKIN